MNVLLLKHTPDPDRVVALAARRCYSSLPASGIEEKLSEDDVQRLLKLLRLRNHLSPFEHVSFTFTVDGVSRALSHQLVRHRIASFSQESQRYVEYMKLDSLPYITPPKISTRPEILRKYDEAMKHALEAYRDMVAAGVPPEDARYVFPNSVETKLVFTLNARSLFNFFEQRCCLKAQWEIRKLAEAILGHCRETAPLVFLNAGPPCRYDRPYCRENDEKCPAFPGKTSSSKETGHERKER